MTVPIPTSPMRQPSDSLALKNQYRHQTYEAAPILSFEEARAQLPVPIMPGSQYDPWIRMYWRVWEIAWTNLHQPAEGTGFVDNYIRPDTHDHIFMWDSAFSALYGIYGRRSFDFSGNLNNFYAWQ
ncbi:MAG: glycoside hydrolase, partial [Chloroflexota bacterium]